MATRSRIQASFAALPLAFEQNQGQIDGQVKYIARANGYTLFLTANDAVFLLHSSSNDRTAIGRSTESPAQNAPRQSNARQESTAVVHMQLVGGNSQAKIPAAGQLSGTTNYFIGNDPSQWHRDIPRYARVSYQDVYPGVNLAFHGAQRQLEFDFVVAPGANPAPIAFHFNGVQGMKTDDNGNLVVSSAAGDVLLHKPVAYQEQNGVLENVDSRFLLKANSQVSFELGNYDRGRELIIDPSVTYATYLGGTLEDDAYGIAIDSSGNAYVTGQTASTNFPIVAGGKSGSNAGGFDAFVSKIAADGSSLIYSTYVGGSGNDSGNAIAVDASGDAFVAGGTNSNPFPTTGGAFQTTLKGTANAFVFELTPTGNNLTYSTYLGGTGADNAQGIALASDKSGDVYVVGKTSSTDFPAMNALQTTVAGGFVTKLNSTGTMLVFSTYLGGGTGDFAGAVAVDSSNNAYVTGKALSASFTTTNGVVQPLCASCSGGFSDAFVTVYKPDGSGYVYSTFLGGTSTDVGAGIAVDSSGNAYVTGVTLSSDFPRMAALQNTYGGNTDAFVTKLNPTGTALVYSTYLGGGSFDAGTSIGVDAAGNAYVTGQTDSMSPTPFPTASPTQAAIGGGFDAFVSELNAAGSQLAFSTYLGGTQNEDTSGNYGAIAVDSAGDSIYVTGNTASTDFPTHTPYPYPEGNANSGSPDAFVVKYTQTATTTSQTFTLTATALTPSSVSPEGSATSTVTATSTNGFTGSVTLACAVSPAVTLGPTCGAASVTPGTPATLTVSTTAATALLRRSPNSHSSIVFYAMFLPISGLSLIGVSFSSIRSRHKKLFALLMIATVMAALLLLPACGGSSKSTGGGSGGTPAGAYTVTVTGTATGATQTGTSPALTLTVN
ncbi:MAG: SBBP repeat-containing protein [Candidatus Sulfotelmatobacter sp.]